MPHYIYTQVKKYGVMTLEEAIMKATSVPAQKVLGIMDRGVLAPEAYADIVVFNLDKIDWAGNYVKPNVPPEGIEFVLVNGKVAYKDKAHTGDKVGEAPEEHPLRRGVVTRDKKHTGEKPGRSSGTLPEEEEKHGRSSKEGKDMKDTRAWRRSSFWAFWGLCS